MTDLLNVTGIKRGNYIPAITFTFTAGNRDDVSAVAWDIRREGTLVRRYASSESDALPRDYAITIDSATQFTLAAHTCTLPVGTYRYQCQVTYADGTPFVFEGDWVVVTNDYSKAAP